MQQRHGVLRRRGEVDRYAVGHGQGEEHAGRPRGVAVHAVQHQPPLGERVIPPDRAAVDLVAQHRDGKRWLKGGTERPPAGHHLSHVLLAPQAQAEAVLASGDARDEVVALGPFAELEAGDAGIADFRPPKGGRGGRGGTGGGGIAHVLPSLPPLPPLAPSSTRSIAAPSAFSRSSTPSYPRSVRPLLWIPQ